ncbi:MAG: hypothetical protein ABI678_15775 [Kofleriaceae bacterium]
MLESEPSESVQGTVVDDVHADLAERAYEALDPREPRLLDQEAAVIRERAVDEAIGTERAAVRSRGLARFSQFVDYAFFLLYALLATRFVLVLIGARATSGFVKLIATISDPFFAPFRDIVDSPVVGPGHFAMPVVVALFAYMVLHFAINRLLRTVVQRRTQL